jgi:hypothetical protein
VRDRRRWELFHMTLQDLGASPLAATLIHHCEPTSTEHERDDTFGFVQRAARQLFGSTTSRIVHRGPWPTASGSRWGVMQSSGSIRRTCRTAETAG